jgi:hypothetical protein
VCAVGTCFNSRGEDCVRCQGRNTLPGVRLTAAARGAEAAVYGAALALWQRRLAAQADAVVVPSRFAARAPAGAARPVDPRASTSCPRRARRSPTARAAAGGEHALVAARLAPRRASISRSRPARARADARGPATGPRRTLARGRPRALRRGA